MLVDINVTQELTTVDGPKSNGRVERMIALVMEGAKVAFWGFPKCFPDVVFPPRASSFIIAIWPEACVWMDDCVNMMVEMGKEDKRRSEVKLFRKRRIKQALPFMMPGFRRGNWPTELDSK